MKIIIRMRITGETSIPPRSGRNRLIGLRAGSVTAFKKYHTFLTKLFLRKKPRTGGAGLLGFHWGGTWVPFGVGTRDGEGTAISLNISQLYEAKTGTWQAANDKAHNVRYWG
jgi:hypothetical protein